MEGAQDSQTDSSGEYLSKMLTFFIALSLLQAIVIAFLIFKGDESEDTPSDLLDPDQLSLQASPVPVNTPKPIVTPTTKPVAKSQKFPLDKVYSYPVRDAEGNPIVDIEYKITEYELTNQVIVNNIYKAIVTDDKEILVFYVELTNDQDQAVQMVTGDYIRLTKNDDDKLIAPDIESDPVEVRPNSTKNTKLGFTLSKSDKKISVQVGELGEDKETIEIR